MDLRKFIANTVRECLNENNQSIINKRIDNALDWINKYHIKISDEKFQEYVNYTNKNLTKIENLVNKINSAGYIWMSDLPTFFTSTIDDIKNNNIDINLGETKTYKQKIEIFYKYTYVGNESHEPISDYELISDRYKIIFKNYIRNITSEITGNELLELLEKNVIMTEYGIMGLSYESVEKYVKENYKIINENNQNYKLVYRGQSLKNNSISLRKSIWVTYDIDFAKEYGNVKEYKLPKNLNILDTDYYGVWEKLIDEFNEGGDYDEYKYEPNDKFIFFLKSKGYDGFINGDNILIFDKFILKENYNNYLNKMKQFTKNMIKEEREYWGSIAAGVLPISVKTKRILISYRSSEVYEPNTWGVWGGKVDFDEEKENLKSVAIREFYEETGYSGKMNLFPAYIYKDKEFEYHNFIGIVQNEFEPELDWETEKFEWVTFDELLKLEPKHFGLKKLLNDKKSLKIIQTILKTKI